VDLNELYSRHQIALIDAQHAVSACTREWASSQVRDYAARIDDFRTGLAAQVPTVIAT
jgi:hypothetical protein